MADHSPNAVAFSNDPPSTGIPGSAVPEHPSNGIPLPAHGFRSLDAQAPDTVGAPAVDVVSAAGVLLLDAAAARLGLTPGAEPDLDLDEARILIDALAGLVAAAQPGLGDAAAPLLEGLRTLQTAYRETAVHPDPPGQGPGEAFLS